MWGRRTWGRKRGLRRVLGDMVLFWGQSNSFGATAGAAALDGKVYPNTLPYRYRVGGVANPPNWIDRGWGTLGRALGPDNVTYYVGPEIGFCQRYTEVAPGRLKAAIKCCLSSSGMEHWHPDSTFPTLDPDGMTAHDRMALMITDAQQAQSARVRAVVVDNGEADSANSTQANLYKARMLAMYDFFNAISPGVVLVVSRLNDTFTGVSAAIVRAAQDELALEAVRKFAVVNTDDVAMSADNIHYPIASHHTKGERSANAYFAKVGA